MSDKHHRHSKHTKFRQNLRGSLQFFSDWAWNDPIVNCGLCMAQWLVHKTTISDDQGSSPDYSSLFFDELHFCAHFFLQNFFFHFYLNFSPGCYLCQKPPDFYTAFANRSGENSNIPLQTTEKQLNGSVSDYSKHEMRLWVQIPGSKILF